ncbi:unnamed protein product [Rotaria socialis]|uniref:Uncharacterized protein n=2 Tax=Rotaria socialis TaxID=392032 RepID=A0A821T7K6_9BILA|nr:unnamed protein product [Rotaria socialis]
MFRSISLVVFIVLSLMKGVSAEWCYDSKGYYYCSSGQTCGSYYGDCRGLPTYAIVAIISSGVLVLSICIRCCVQLNSNNTQRTVTTVTQNPGHIRVQVYATGNNAPSHSRNIAPVHNIREDAPPSYDAALSSNTEPPKY